MTLNARQQALKEEFIKLRNTWAPQWESILCVDDAFLQFDTFATHYQAEGSHRAICIADSWTVRRYAEPINFDQEVYF